MLSKFCPFLFTCALSIGAHNLHLIFNFRYFLFSHSFVELVTFCALRDSRFRLLRMFALFYFLFNCGKFSPTHTIQIARNARVFTKSFQSFLLFLYIFFFFVLSTFGLCTMCVCGKCENSLCVAAAQRSAPVTYKEHTPSGCVCLVYLCFAEDDGALWLGPKTVHCSLAPRTALLLLAANSACWNFGGRSGKSHQQQWENSGSAFVHLLRSLSLSHSLFLTVLSLRAHCSCFFVMFLFFWQRNESLN